MVEEEERKAVVSPRSIGDVEQQAAAVIADFRMYGNKYKQPPIDWGLCELSVNTTYHELRRARIKTRDRYQKTLARLELYSQQMRDPFIIASALYSIWTLFHQDSKLAHEIERRMQQIDELGLHKLKTSRNRKLIKDGGFEKTDLRELISKRVASWTCLRAVIEHRVAALQASIVLEVTEEMTATPGLEINIHRHINRVYEDHHVLDKLLSEIPVVHELITAASLEGLEFDSDSRSTVESTPLGEVTA